MVRINVFIGLQVIPALAALTSGAVVPGDVERLQAAFTDIDQVLLQRVVAEGVPQLEIARLAVETGGRYPEILALAVEPDFEAVKFRLASLKSPSTLAPVAGSIALW